MDDLRCPLAEAAETHGERVALLAPHRAYTYREFHDYALGAADNFERAGIREGDVAAIALPNGLQYPVLLLALFRLGAVACPVSTRLPIGNMLMALRSVKCRDIVTPSGASVTATAGALYSLSPEMLVDERPGSPRPDTVPLSRPATIYFTSGSTGRPKAVLHAFGNHYHSAVASNANLPLTPGDRWLVSLPFHHVAGMGVLFRCLLAGATAVIPSAGESLAESIARHEVTHVSLVATQLYRLLQDPAAADALGRLKAILLGGSAVSPRLIEEAVARKLPIYTSYGLTETASQIAATPPGATPAQLLTSGRPLVPGTVRIGTDGDIQVRGEALFKGYIDHDKVNRPLTGDGWFTTGDLGAFDDDGYLKVTGRRDNMFVSGGENIQPEEIEQVLCRMGGIEAALVVPVADEEFGQRAVAFVRMESGALPHEEELVAFVAGHLPRFKAPRVYLPWPDHLQDVGIKPSRAEFAALAADAPAVRIRRRR